MLQTKVLNVHDRADMRDRVGLFDSREQAGRLLADMLAEHLGAASGPAGPSPQCRLDAVVLAIPAGGVPVGAAAADKLQLPLDAVVACKVSPSWNPEVGYGAVAFDGTVELNDRLVNRLPLNARQIDADIARAREKVHRRVQRFRGDRPMLDLIGRTAVLIDDGLASGWTMIAAVNALANAFAASIVIAVPTASQSAIDLLAGRVDAIYCLNVRGGCQFAVAEAYRDWHDVPESDAAALLRARPGG